MTSPTRPSARGAGLALAATIAGTVGGSAIAPAPASAGECLVRTWGSVCQSTNWVGEYISYQTVVRSPSTPGEWAAQCDVQAVSRIRTHSGTTINYEDDVDWGCAPGSASLTQNVYTWRHSGAYKDHERRANVDDVCGGWREMTSASGTAFAHFHGYACYET